MPKSRTGHRGARSYVARCCSRLTGICKSRKGRYKTTSKHPKYGRCPDCDKYVERECGAYNWISRGQRVKSDVRAGH